jgi:hypothetical protein
VRVQPHHVANVLQLLSKRFHPLLPHRRRRRRLRTLPSSSNLGRRSQSVHIGEGGGEIMKVRGLWLCVARNAHLFLQLSLLLLAKLPRLQTFNLILKNGYNFPHCPCLLQRFFVSRDFLHCKPRAPAQTVTVFQCTKGM